MIKREITTMANSQPPTANKPIQKPIKKTRYKYAGREKLSTVIGKAIPQQLFPTKRINFIFGGIFILVLILAIFQFPFTALMSGSTEIVIKVGFPWAFLELGVSTVEESPIRVGGLILDLILYIILAYAIDITIKLLLRNPVLQSRKNAKKRPTIFKDRKPSIAEKVTQRVAEGEQLK